MIWLQNENNKMGGGLFDIYGDEYIDAVQKAAKSDKKGTWEIFRNGTDDEYITLVDELGYIGKEFEKEESLREIMQIGKRRLTGARDKEAFQRYLKIGFGNLFERFWGEDETVAPAEPPARMRELRQGAYGS